METAILTPLQPDRDHRETPTVYPDKVALDAIDIPIPVGAVMDDLRCSGQFPHCSQEGQPGYPV